MKIFFILCGTLFFHVCLAQTSTQTVAYTNNLDAYVGTWEYATTTDTFRIVLRRGVVSIAYIYSESLLGGYRYVKNGVLIGDYTQGVPDQFLDKDFSEDDNSITINATNSCVHLEPIPPNELRLFFKDIGLGKTTGRGLIKLLSPTQIHWILKDREGLFSPDNVPPLGFSVPEDVIMTKISDSWTPPTLPLRPLLPLPLRPGNGGYLPIVP